MPDESWPPLDVAAWEYSVAHADGTRNWVPCGDAAVARLQVDSAYVVRRRGSSQLALPDNDDPVKTS